MKKIALLFITLCILSHVKADDKDKSTEKKRKFTFTGSFGVNFALGGLRSRDSIPVRDTTHIHGSADLGYYFDISAGYHITNNIGIMIMLNGNFDDFNTVAYQNGIAYDYANPMNSGELTSSGHYFILQYLIGPYFEIPCSRNRLARVGIKLLAGSMHANYPTLISDYYTQTVSSGSGFSYRISVDYEQYVSEGIRLSFNLGYSGGTITYPSLALTPNNQSVNSYSSTSPRAMSVGLIQFSTGVVIML